MASKALKGRLRIGLCICIVLAALFSHETTKELAFTDEAFGLFRKADGSRFPSPANKQPIEDALITGERIIELCDVAIYTAAYLSQYQVMRHHSKSIILVDEDDPLEMRTRLLIEQSFSFYVKLDWIDDFKRSVLPIIKHKFVLVTHNSDHSGGLDKTILQHPNLVRWYGQNMVPSEKTFGIPIGLENVDTWGRTNFRTIAKYRVNRKTKLLYFQFRDYSNPTRSLIRKQLRSNGFVENSPEEWESYIAELSKHRFCAAPPGNGIDTHRAWECIYLGVTPIIIKTEVMTHWFGGLNVVWVKSFDEVTPKFLDSLPPVKISTSLPAAARMSFYRDKILHDRMKNMVTE